LVDSEADIELLEVGTVVFAEAMSDRKVIVSRFVFIGVVVALDRERSRVGVNNFGREILS